MPAIMPQAPLAPFALRRRSERAARGSARHQQAWSLPSTESIWR